MRWDEPIPNSQHIVPAIVHSMALGVWFGVCSTFWWGFGFDTSGDPVSRVVEIVGNVFFCAVMGAMVGVWVGIAASPGLAVAYIAGITLRDRRYIVLLTTMVSSVSALAPLPLELIPRCISVSVTAYVAFCLFFATRAWQRERRSSSTKYLTHNR